MEAYDNTAKRQLLGFTIAVNGAIWHSRMTTPLIAPIHLSIHHDWLDLRSRTCSTSYTFIPSHLQPPSVLPLISTPQASIESPTMPQINKTMVEFIIDADEDKMMDFIGLRNSGKTIVKDMNYRIDFQRVPVPHLIPNTPLSSS